MVNYDGLYNKESFGNKLTENHFSDKKLHFRIIENGTILPNKRVAGTNMQGFDGLVNEKNEFVKRSALYFGTGGAYTPDEEVIYSLETVIYLGPFTNVWGHCITDNIKRLWFLQSEIYKKCFKHCRIVYTRLEGGYDT